MTHLSDDIYLGNFFGTQSFTKFDTSGGAAAAMGGSFLTTDNPSSQVGVGPMGRIAFHAVMPLTKATNNLSTAVAYAAAGNATLVAGTGITSGLAPDGSGVTAYYLDTPRSVSFTTSASASGVTATVTGYDGYGRKTTATVSLPASATTVNTTKTFWAVTQVAISASTSSTTVAIGTADTFGLPWYIMDAGYLVSVKWAGALAQDTGSFIAGVTLTATASTGDPRGTYAPSSASNGTNLLVIGMHLNSGQCGAAPLVTNAIGVTPA